jgi:hypothetical protein
MNKRMVVVIIFVVVIGTACSHAASFLRPAFSGVYHEASCPSVDVSRMQRMKRDSAEAVGLLPAPDCHPHVRVRYLGISGASASSPNTDAERAVQVRGYTRADGTFVDSYTRVFPQHVNGYTREDGAHVDDYDRSKPNPRN